MMKDPISRRSRGFGFITYADPVCVDRALAQPNHVLDSRRVRVFLGTCSLIGTVGESTDVILILRVRLKQSVPFLEQKACEMLGALRYRVEALGQI